MRDNVIRRIWYAAGRFRSQTGRDPTIVYLGADDLQEVMALGVIHLSWGGWNLQAVFDGVYDMTPYVSGRAIVQVKRKSYVAVGI